MTTPKDKDIEAAEKLVDREFLQLCETALAKGQIEDYSALNELFEINRKVAQALAAAREEGRRDMRDECLKDLDHHMEQLEGPNSYWGKQALHELRMEIEGIPTNAPEGESE